MKLGQLYLIALVFSALVCGEQAKENRLVMKKEKNLHHFNYRGAFMSGYYEGEFPLLSVIQNGDFGLGTFNNLNGELIVLD